MKRLLDDPAKLFRFAARLAVLALPYPFSPILLARQRRLDSALYKD